MTCARVLLGIAAMLIAGLGAARPAAALGESCTLIGATGLAFGSYTASTQASSTGTFQVRCTCSGLACTGVSYRVQINAGTSGTFSPRKMALGANRLDYNLSTQSGMSPIWGSGSSGTAAPTACFLLIVGQTVTTTYTVYGRIDAGIYAAASAVAYTDPLTVTLDYFTAIPPLTCAF